MGLISAVLLWVHSDSKLLYIPNETAAQDVMEKRGERENFLVAFDRRAYTGLS